MARLRLLVSCGEISGDALAARTVTALRTRHPELEAAGCGGSQLAAAGAEIILPQERISFIGWSAPLARLGRLWSDRRQFLSKAADWNPDAVLLVDAPGWNRGLLRWARKRGLPVHWIAPPQLWAWKRRRAPWLGGVSVQPLFKFEMPCLERWGAHVHWRGFPRSPVSPSQGIPLLALLPGTRETLWRACLPRFAETAEALGWRAAVAVPQIPSPELAAACAGLGLVWMPAEDLLSSAGLCLAVPGTGCLDVARRGIPLVVSAVLPRLDTWLAGRLLTPGSRALPNRILGRPCIEEFYGPAATVEALTAALQRAVQHTEEFRAQAPLLEERLGPADAEPVDFL